jgi:hypothetical protein
MVFQSQTRIFSVFYMELHVSSLQIFLDAYNTNISKLLVKKADDRWLTSKFMANEG